MTTPDQLERLKELRTLIERLRSRKGLSYQESEQIATALESLLSENEALRGKMRMIVSHATGGSPSDIERSTNDICCDITANRNLIYRAGKDATAQALFPESPKP